MLPHACPTNLYLTYWLTFYVFSATSCRFLSTSQMTLSLQPRHARYHFTSPCSLLYASLRWLDHSWVLAYCHTINIFDHFYVYWNSYIFFSFKPSTAFFTMSHQHPFFIFNPPLTHRQHSTKPQNHNFHWLQISSLVRTTQLHDTPQTKIFRFGFSQPCWEVH